MASALNTVCSPGTGPVAVARISRLPFLQMKAMAAHVIFQQRGSPLEPGDPSVALAELRVIKLGFSLPKPCKLDLARFQC